MSAAGMSVLSPSGLDVMAELDGLVRHQDEVGIPPEDPAGLRLNCIRDANLVWLHAPDGYVGVSGALEIGFANAAGVSVYAEEIPSDTALRSLITIAPLDLAIAQASATRKFDDGAAFPPRQGSSSVAREPGNAHKSAQDIMLLITEEIGELARQNPGQRHRISHA
jgi:hypothetical protein